MLYLSYLLRALDPVAVLVQAQRMPYRSLPSNETICVDGPW